MVWVRFPVWVMVVALANGAEKPVVYREMLQMMAASTVRIYPRQAKEGRRVPSPIHC